VRKVAITLIIVGILVVIGAKLFIGSEPEPEFSVSRDDTTLRLTTQGEIVGVRDRFGARAWLGIPYAEPPVGDNRWRAPQPPMPHDGIFEAMSIGNICPQYASQLSDTGAGFTPGAIAGSEDCLYLNIWSPPNAVGLPVMFWIHGGGNTVGHGGSYSGAALATNRDVVVVSINYRLGFFGWFSHPGLKTGNLLDDSGNYGNLDALQALHWVAQNIALFGGNPDNVTVFGESAGAFDTLALMASPLAEDMFHRAIVQSGGFNVEPLARAQNYVAEGGHPASSAEIVAHLLIADGTVTNVTEAKEYQDDMGPARLRDYLLSKPVEDFFVQFDAGGFGMISVPANIGDGYVLPALSTQEIFSDANNHNMVPIILGTNRDEPSTFMVRNPTYIDTWFGFIPRLKDKDNYKSIVKYGALSWKERGVDSLANYMTAAGNPDVFTYRFDWDEEPSQMGFDLSVALGAGHGLEIPFAFGDFAGGLGIDYVYPNNEAQWSLADSMTSYWSEFAYAGDPGRGREEKQIEWLRWGTQGMRSMILDSPADKGIFMDDAEVTIASIKAELAVETGFSQAKGQCAAYARNFQGENFVVQEYEDLNDTCASIDPADNGFF